MSNEPKRFEEWKDVECDECARYWDSSCDGVPQDAHKPCRSFVANRRVSIEGRVNALENAVHSLRINILCTAVPLILHILFHLMGWY